jgi:hypothetical protein
MTDVIHQREIPVARGAPVVAVHARVVEEVALLPPRLLVDLPPLHGGVDPGAQLEVERARLAVRRARGLHDPPLLPRPIEHLAAIRGDGDARDASREDFRLTLVERELVHREPGASGRGLRDEDRPLGARIRGGVGPHRHGQGHDPPVEAPEVDADRVGVVRLGVARGPLVRLRAGRVVAVLPFGLGVVFHILLVALVREGRGIVGPQHRDVGPVRGGVPHRARVWPARGEPQICAREEVEVPPVPVPRRRDRVRQGIRELVCLAGLGRPDDDAPEVVRERPGVGEPPGVR